MVNKIIRMNSINFTDNCILNRTIKFYHVILYHFLIVFKIILVLEYITYSLF